MPQHTLTIHYKGYIITRKNFGKYQWRLSEFETEKEALNAIDEHILYYSIVGSKSYLAVNFKNGLFRCPKVLVPLMHGTYENFTKENNKHISFTEF